MGQCGAEQCPYLGDTGNSGGKLRRFYLPITVVGSVALDTLETPFGSADNVLGGAASHFALAASYYDQVNLVAIVGNDFPEEYTGYLRGRNIDLRGLQVVPGRTFRWGGRYYLDLNSRDTLFTELGVFADFHPDLPDDYCRAEILFLANIQPSLQLDVLRQAIEHRTRPAAGAGYHESLDRHDARRAPRRSFVASTSF